MLDDLPETILSTLPPVARAKLETAFLARESAVASYRHASDAEQEARIELARVESMAARQRAISPGFFGQPRQTEAPEDREARVDGPVESARRALEARVKVRYLAAEAQSAFAFLENITGWLRRHAAPGGTFRPAKVVSAKSKDPLADIQRLRTRLGEIADLFQKTEAAPVPKAALLAAAHAEIDRMAAGGGLTINAADRTGSPLGLTARFRIGTHASGHFVGDAGASTLAWLLRDHLKAEAEALIEALPDDGVMSDAEREAAFSDLAAERLQIERQEESLIELAEREGRIIARRADLDPRAFLCIAD